VWSAGRDDRSQGRRPIRHAAGGLSGTARRRERSGKGIYHEPVGMAIARPTIGLCSGRDSREGKIL
jgi:hypothetical protein